MSKNVKFNELLGRYELEVEGHTVFARTRQSGDTLYIDYVEAPPELRGKGAAGQFMKGLMEDVRAKGLKATPICGYAATWLQRHPEYEDVTESS